MLNWKGAKNCQLWSSLHPGCQTWQTNREDDLWSRKLFEIFNTKPPFNVPCSFSLVRKGSPVVPSPSQVIMVPCVLPWRGAFSLKEFPWCWLCLFRHPLQCHNHQNILMTLFLGNILITSITKLPKTISIVFPVCGWLGTGKNLFPFSLQIEGRGSERSSIQDFQKTDSVISTSLLLLISKIQKLWQHLWSNIKRIENTFEYSRKHNCYSQSKWHGEKIAQITFYVHHDPTPSLVGRVFWG